MSQAVMLMAIREGLSFDELNKLYVEEKEGDLRSMPFEQFFGEMGISKQQKDKRVETAEDIKAFILIALREMYYEMHEGEYGEYNPTETIREGYRSLLDRLAIPLTAMFAALHPEEVATEVVSATTNHPEDPYFFSEDRATLIAENEANSIWNDSEFQDAIMTGKTNKTWHAIIDNRTRDTHRATDGTTIPIMDAFWVGDSLLLFPRDESLGSSADEIVNCRCWLTYS